MEDTIYPYGVFPGPPLFFDMFVDKLPFSRLDIHQRGEESCIELVMAEGDMEVLTDALLTDMSVEPDIHAQEVDAVVGMVSTI